MEMDIIEDSIQSLDLQLLNLLLVDNSTKRNIVWATNDYTNLGEQYSPECAITTDLISGKNNELIKPRVTKAKNQQSNRTRNKAEVFTPSWICNVQNNLVDEQWFGRPDVFNNTTDKKWKATEAKIMFPAKSKKTWQDYVNAKRLEITCGEAPYLVSRYDTVTGKPITDVHKRIGLLDRKLRVIDENTDNETDWFAWVKKAYQSIYGYEYQGDSLLLARENLLFTFIDYMIHKWDREPTDSELRQVACIISWNIWQMDGLKYTAPYSEVAHPKKYEQMTLFDVCYEDECEKDGVPCIIRDWKDNCYVEFRKGKKTVFDAVVGNPPYQLTNEGDGNGRNPIYHLFIDSTRLICKRGSFIHPARCLFNAGKTPKEWNKKILNDEHFKVINYWADTSYIFPTVDVKGGIAITFWDDSQIYEKIGTFSAHEELRSIMTKVLSSDFKPFADMVYPRDLYRLTDELYIENEWAVERPSKGHKYDVGSNIFHTFPELFSDEKPQNGEEYAAIFGREKNIRILKWIKRKYIKEPDNFEYYKIFIPKANGSGNLGDALSIPVLGKPYVGHTVTFLSIGKLETEYEANAVLKYVKTKFARIMLGTLKVTQDNPRETWMNVPLQDFTQSSDIDWEASIAEIDRQLYKKYRLSREEAEFIEKTAKKME